MSVVKMSSTKVFSSYFDSNIFLLKITGFWLYDQERKSFSKYIKLFYNVFWHCYLHVFYLPTEILFLFYSFGDLSLCLRSLRDMGNHFALLYKAINYFLLRHEFVSLLNILRSTESSYEDFEDFHPIKIRDEEKKEAKKWTTYFWCFVNAICFSMFASGLYVFIFESEKQYVVKNNETIYNQKQPVYTVSPFGSKTRQQFLITFVCTIVALTFYAWMIVALDSLFITFMSCVSAHLKILKGAFKTLRSRCVKRMHFYSLKHVDVLLDPQKLQDEVHGEMMKCINHLQTIFSVSEKLEALYNVQTFVQTVMSLLEMCFSLYLMTETLDENIGNEVTYLIATGFELLMYCWFGNRITEASVEVFQSVYESDWYSTNYSFRKQMILTMTRMQRPICLTIGKFSPLTFRTFLTMVRGAYSVFTFLRQRKDIRRK